MVCGKLYSVFRDVFQCETRISVEYIFEKMKDMKNPEIHVKMAGRKSLHRSKVKPSRLLENRSKYFSYQIFTKNSQGISSLSKEDIDDPAIWYRSPQSTVDVKHYIGIAVSVFDNGFVDFILQIDFLDEFKFGDHNTDDEIIKFVEKYLLAYVNIVTLSYLLNLNNKRKIMEV